ncbi:hypothetical protein [Nitrospina watsonii]|uniref:Uncharacterized protein n=1 Tax=Nitrospina watsonii TaxID=1323948 RepID=A0ABN8W5E6_9BACT|nr:hypothetical protein [Nitrospina watsonii]CAI2719481.1 conserved protein of unknown function [Nitrospina watsonii]
MSVYKAWKPFQDIPAPLYLESMVKDGDGLRLVLFDGSVEGRRLRIHFKEVLAFRSANEKCLLKTWEENESWEGHSSLLTVEDSEFVEWLHAQSFGMFSDRRITHYAVYTPEDCLDILTDQKPIVDQIAIKFKD